MRVYRFLLPDVGNDGRDYFEARVTWQEHATRVAGGFTKFPRVEGLWSDAGELYVDQSHPYEVAVEDGIGEATRVYLTREWFNAFPDQLACYSVEVGQGWIDNRPEVTDTNP